MLTETEYRIGQLCKKAIAAEPEDSINHVIPELRAALQEHIRSAKESLEAQASAVSFLDVLTDQAQGGSTHPVR
jgi:hypothetical protein